jgi:hypothetical protein
MTCGNAALCITANLAAEWQRRSSTAKTAEATPLRIVRFALKAIVAIKMRADASCQGGHEARLMRGPRRVLASL